MRGIVRVCEALPPPGVVVVLAAFARGARSAPLGILLETKS